MEYNARHLDKRGLTDLPEGDRVTYGFNIRHGEIINIVRRFMAIMDLIS